MTDLEIRPAAPGDLPAIVAMLADDPNQHVVVAVRESQVVGTLQLTVVSDSS